MVQKAMKFTPKVLLSAPRRSAGIPNPSGTKALYTLSTYSFETHKKTIELRVLDVDSGESHELAKNDEISDLNWLNEDEFACLQAEKDGSTSLYVASVAKVIEKTEFGKSHYVAGKIEGPASNLKVKKLPGDEGYAVVVSAQANADGTLFDPNKAKQTHATGKLYTGLFARHWDTWESKQKNALFYGKLSKTAGKYELSGLRNALTNTGLESPIKPFGGTDNFDISGGSITFVAKDPGLNPALNTKSNVYITSIESWSGDKRSMIKVLIPDYEGASSSPAFSPDGSTLAFLSMKTGGYEADRNDIFLLHLDPTESSSKQATPAKLSIQSDAKNWDRSPQSIVFSADGRSLLVTAEDVGTSKVYSISGLHWNRTIRPLTQHSYISDVRPLASGKLFVSGSSITENSFFAIVDPLIPDGRLDSLITWTNSNSGEGSKFGLKSKQVSSIWTPASNPKVNKEVHSIVVKPSKFDSSKKYPVAYIIHGGPQGAWGDSWSTRWNPAVFAEQGYICICPNPTGSTGYGQAFTDAIRRNWGGDPYQDIANVFEWVGQNMPEADNDRAVALGASYGGYMMNWIQGHDLGRKFKCLVCHDGITSFAGGMLATEELYFPFFDLGGTPWFDPGYKPAPGDPSSAAQGHKNFGASVLSDWRKWDPSEHFVNWSTPQLVIHSSKDYRLPIAEGLAAFNVLQSRGVDSQFLHFPDENHWVLKPENSLLWHKVVLNWINKYAGLEAYAAEEHDGEEFYGGVREDEEEVEEMPSQGKVEM
ncbi:Dipeptidyl-peptidase 5 [Fulvia fulva]|uniref:Dipeptidyl-peptidase V n=1 Tax=Passalora fulva TaxID=5499 RepID=A0A9Q8LC32_PASFU|nr:Dipeptidyl-peptidase 5 [Fulvia fulva]KAK4629223.1 Dipeptidyl-peptidase 5 [Fulvia fulva]KAK4630298.1 Dipeptidyl-peptidase 5 [Fulvia fulva]UJO14735.1 Dipeptidyl-peptidase 5 [Fulvia fulva]WPV12230.1 Dipeptidyl-peptidase 5 [Fulvia fulva]WPV27431.1 Dipeptidyl-peptidase 5 [Fulvia fulva]